MPIKIKPKLVTGSIFLTLNVANIYRLTLFFVNVPRPSSTALPAPYLKSRMHNCTTTSKTSAGPHPSQQRSTKLQQRCAAAARRTRVRRFRVRRRRRPQHPVGPPPPPAATGASAAADARRRNPRHRRPPMLPCPADTVVPFCGHSGWFIRLPLRSPGPQRRQSSEFEYGGGTTDAGARAAERLLGHRARGGGG